MRENKFNYSTSSLTAVSTPFHYQRSNIKHNTSPAKNEATMSYNSRVSVEGSGKLTHQRDLSTDSRKQFPKHWEPRRTASKN